MRERWIIFDAMGVIFEVGDDTNELLVPYVQQRNPAIEAKAIRETYRLTSLGQLSSRQFWDQVGLGQQFPAVETEYLETCLTFDRGFLPVAKRLYGKYALALLSNDVKEWSAYLRRKYQLDDLFRTIVISGDVGCRKPDPAIYRRLFDRIQVPGSSCLLLDDRGRNLKTAAELGMKTVRFVREECSDVFQADGEIRSFEEFRWLEWTEDGKFLDKSDPRESA